MSAIPKELFGLKVEVVRSKRKTSALHIIGDELQIRVPNRVRDGKIVEILETKKRWIRNKVVQIQSRPARSGSNLRKGNAHIILLNQIPKISENYLKFIKMKRIY